MISKSQSKHPSHGRIIRHIQRPDAATIDAFKQCYSGFIVDQLGKYGAMACAIQPLSPGMRLCGPAVTCLSPDLAIRKMAVDLAQPGDVLVIAAEGITERACFGEYTAHKMQLKGIAGVVIDGATRDAAQIRELGFPTFVRGVTPRNYSYPIDPLSGAVNVEVSCGGIIVRPGDLVFGDDDGVVVVPLEIAGQLAGTITAALQAEESKRSQQLHAPYNIEAELLARGYRFE